jgi:ribose 5-phosphate isomerase B
MKIALTTDHAGFELLKEIEAGLTVAGHDCVNFGPLQFNPEDDYPAFMFAAAHAVANGDCERGIILGGSGTGEAIAANRIAGVRCALFYGPALAKAPIDAEGHMSTDPYEIVKLSRQHNNSNVLSLSARFLSSEEMQTAITIWLETPFTGLERHSRRIAQLDNLV